MATPKKPIEVSEEEQKSDTKLTECLSIDEKAQQALSQENEEAQGNNKEDPNFFVNFRQNMQKLLKECDSQESVEDYVPKLNKDFDVKKFILSVDTLYRKLKVQKCTSTDSPQSDEQKQCVSTITYALLSDLLGIFWSLRNEARVLKDSLIIEKSLEICIEFIDTFLDDENCCNILITKREGEHLLEKFVKHSDDVLLQYLAEKRFRQSISRKQEEILHYELSSLPLSQSYIVDIYAITGIWIIPDASLKGRKCAYVAWIARTRKDDCLFDMAQHPTDIDDEKSENTKIRKLPEKKTDAEQEADCVQKWLKKAIYLPGVTKDWTKEMLLLDLHNFLSNLKDICSVVVVFIMAHGCEGYVYDVNETKVALKEIKDCIKSAGIPSEIPKLLIVQACRTDEAPRSEASTGLDSPIKKAVEIGKELLQNLGVPIPVNSKPENLKLENFKIENPKCEVAESAEYPNFITIMACSKGQKALRNVFMPLLLEELGKGNEINDAVRKVKQRMKRKSGETSTPEICNDCDSLIYLSKEKGHQ